VRPDRWRLIALVVFVLDVLVCGTWAYRAARSMLQVLSGSGSGGIGGVNAGVVEGLFTIVPPIATIWLAGASGSTLLAKRWRNAHLAAVLAMAILPLIGGLRVMMVSIVVFLPMQVFFVVGAIAIWIAARRRRPDAPSEVSA
jgi:hypothetical protein